MIVKELKQFWSMVKTCTAIVMVVALFFSMIECIRAYQTLRDLHLWAGYGFLLILAGLIIWAVWMLYRVNHDRPLVLKVPDPVRVRKYSRYLLKYIRRLEENPQFSVDQQKQIFEQRIKLQERIKKANSSRKYMAAIELAENETILPSLKILDAVAEKTIRQSVRDIMLAVTVSPYRSIDLMVVIYRNIGMIQNITTIYNSRPRLRESLLIIYDTIRVVATVNFVSLSAKMLENVTRGLPGAIPGISRIVDSCTEGLSAGLLSSITGHAAKHRCRAFRRWSYQDAKESIAIHLKTFTADVGKMFFMDITPHIRIPGGLTLEKWREIKDNVAKGFSDTVSGIYDFVRSKTRKQEPKSATE